MPTFFCIGDSTRLLSPAGHIQRTGTVSAGGCDTESSQSHVRNTKSYLGNGAFEPIKQGIGPGNFLLIILH